MSRFQALRISNPLHYHPARAPLTGAMRECCWRKKRDLNPRHRLGCIRFRIGRIQPDSAILPATTLTQLACLAPFTSPSGPPWTLKTTKPRCLMHRGFCQRKTRRLRKGRVHPSRSSRSFSRLPARHDCPCPCGHTNGSNTNVNYERTRVDFLARSCRRDAVS